LFTATTAASSAPHRESGFASGPQPPQLVAALVSFFKARGLAHPRNRFDDFFL